MQANENTHCVHQNSRSILLDQLNDACIALFLEYGLSIQPSCLTEQQSQHRLTRGSSFIALISMTNPKLRLSIALQTQQEVLEASFPPGHNLKDPRELQDWIGELSNQLSGRLKNKMLLYDCKLNLGIPTVIQGDNLYIDLPRRSEISRHPYTTQSGQSILLSLSTLIDTGFTLCEPDNNQIEETLDEGEMLFF